MTGRRVSNAFYSLGCAGTLLLATTASFAQTPAFKAPPRTISDIASTLDQDKPDPQRVTKLKAQAEAKPPANADDRVLMNFLYERGQALSSLGRSKEAIDDLKRSLELSRKSGDDAGFRIATTLIREYRNIGDFPAALALHDMIAKEFIGPGRAGRAFNNNRLMSAIFIQTGEIGRAETVLRRSENLFEKSRGWQNVDHFRPNWESNIEEMRGRIQESRGRFTEAEQSFQKALTLWNVSMAAAHKLPNPPAAGAMEVNADYLTAFLGRAKLQQGKFAEAEADFRRALLSRLKAHGKYHADTPFFASMLARALQEQGRHKEAERLFLTALEIYQALGYPDEANSVVIARDFLAGSYSLQGRNEEVLQVYELIDKGVANWEPLRRDKYRLSRARAYALYAVGRADEGTSVARETFEQFSKQLGQDHYTTALARGVYAIGLFRGEKMKEALEQFRIAMPVLMSASRETDDEEIGASAAREQRLRNIIATYIITLAWAPELAGGSEAVAAESFPLAEILRGRTVQKALAASSARVSAKDAALADLVRLEQDLEKQAGAQLGMLNNMLARPPQERDENELKELRAGLDRIRKERNGARLDIEKKFPQYAELIEPRPPTVEGIRKVMKDGEVFLSFYFGNQGAFVWAIPKTGKLGFKAINLRNRDLEAQVNKLRAALEPQASSIDEIPAFDLKLGHELYSTLLKPIEESWKPAKSLIVVTNGALGLLPLGLLPTEPVEIQKGELPFEEYKKVPWLARTHSVTMIPAASALLTLRGLPPGSPKRERLIAFGDPYFNSDHAAEAATETKIGQQAAATRGVPLVRRNSSQTMGVDSAELGLLPRLPDTAEEVRSIAIALQADPSKVLHLGKAANEKTVKTTDLSRFRIVAFATHGLVPGELNGLTQPALALTAPEVADVDGDGLLTMEEILSLKLDADWVVLSACNTGTGAGAGAEAASGLGRAFFYAGTRALLVTNWSVHSASARELVTDLFTRQSANPKLARGEALREAMMALAEQGGFKDRNGKLLFSYAHPLFWAPYTIIGDGGS